MADTEVPLDLRRQIQELEDAGAPSANRDVVAYVDALPPELPEECPECGAPLTHVTVFAGADGDAVAVRMACKGTHAGGTVASFIYEVDTEELYLETEERPARLTYDDQ